MVLVPKWFPGRRPTWTPARAVCGAFSLLLGCAGCGKEAPQAAPPGEQPLPGERAGERQWMVSAQLEERDIKDRRVLAAMRAVPRHLFVPEDVRAQAYADRPLPIGWGQTISQPYIVAFMTQALELQGGEKVLEVGTGSGYQAAVLAAMGCKVFSIEIVAPLAEQAGATLKALGYAAQVRAGDGYRGWPEEAPFDAVIVTAAPDHVPQPLLDQLAVGGAMIVPVGDWAQDLLLLRKTATGVTRQAVLPVRFVPMTGEAERAGKR